MFSRLSVCAMLVVCWFAAWSAADVVFLPSRTTDSVKSQFREGHESEAAMSQLTRMEVYVGSFVVVCLVGLGMFWSDLKKHFAMLIMALLIVSSSGCIRPFEKIDLQTIGSNEEGFLIPLVGDQTKQGSTHSEDLLMRSLVQTKQVRIPQQWVQRGYEYAGPNGSWQPAAVLIKVDRSPVTCEWTADPNTGTGTRNEAIWVMTSDQVEFSTGWTCTGRIASREDCVKFLYNYPNGSIKSVMDREVRALVQTQFGLEVTDQPMSKLRSDATPHILSVVKRVTEFFKDRGLTITNLGISGGFIYTDKKISDRMTELFVAEQGEAIAIAKANSLQKEAEGMASAARLKAKGEADAIQAIADAKSYEIQKAKEDMETYLQLKRMEIEKLKLEKWDGRFPSYYMGNSSPDLLLQLPKPEEGRR